ncbi:MAG: P-loop NTPase [Desulfobacteraceae bacterium]|jgi:non-specific protein-tyrosine kinase
MVEILKAIKRSNSKSKQANDDAHSNMDNNRVAVNRSGWISPQYRESRRVALDYQILERNRLIGLLPESAESGYYKVLRTQIQQRLRENGWNTLMVTSVHPGEGKSLTAINLSAMFAKEFDQTVLLVDAHLKSQAIHRYLGYDSERGLVDFLLGGSELKDIIVWPGVEKFSVISGGRICDEGTEVLNSPRMRSLVEDMKHRYRERYLFFDVPPVLGGADAMAFADLVDAIVVVVQGGKTRMPDIQKAVSYLPKHKLLGFVMNRL